MFFVAFYMGMDMRLGAQLKQEGISSLMVRVLAAPAFLAPLAVAIVMPRFGAQKILGTGLACETAGLALSAWAANDTHVMILLGTSFLFVAGIGISVPALIARVAGVSDAPVRGLAVSLYTFVLFIGASIGPWLAMQTAHMRLENMYGLLALLLGSCTIYASTGWKRAVTSVTK